MKKYRMPVQTPDGKSHDISVVYVHNLVIGSGAAGLNAAVQLYQQGSADILIVTEGLNKSVSINTGSDKQTYYKLSLYGEEPDSPYLMAKTYENGGGMHGDLALVEASNSARAFLNLVNLGVPFPRDAYGQFVGYKTDHDPRQRATSIGPFTSKSMCEALIIETKRLGIPAHEDRNVVKLLVLKQGDQARAAGAIALDAQGDWEVYLSENLILAVGGPGGIYQTSVYPGMHTGAIGLALLEGALAQNLSESQFGLASIQYRWNVSGTYMQVIPRLFSTDTDGLEVHEFLTDYYTAPGDMFTHIFLKGYQWPFDSRKVQGGSSLIDILVYIETVIRRRHVFLDFRTNPDGFRFELLSPEAYEYLSKSNALISTPIERLRAMNPKAIALYQRQHIDLEKEPLEVAVCAQHNNGGLAANHWWESVNIKHLFPVGEVNGSHGVYRPGGASLNAGQVGGIRLAEYIVHRCQQPDLPITQAEELAGNAVLTIVDWLARGQKAGTDWQTERIAFQARMSRSGAFIRSLGELEDAVQEAWQQWHSLNKNGCCYESSIHKAEALNTRQLCFTHAVYLETILFLVKSGVGSRGSSLVIDSDGRPFHPALGANWNYQPENKDFRSYVLETVAHADGWARCTWVQRRPMVAPNAWFETAWVDYLNGKIYDV